MLTRNVTIMIKKDEKQKKARLRENFYTRIPRSCKKNCLCCVSIEATTLPKLASFEKRFQDPCSDKCVFAVFNVRKSKVKWHF